MLISSNDTFACLTDLICIDRPYYCFVDSLFYANKESSKYNLWSDKNMHIKKAFSLASLTFYLVNHLSNVFFSFLAVKE